MAGTRKFNLQPQEDREKELSIAGIPAVLVRNMGLFADNASLRRLSITCKAAWELFQQQLEIRNLHNKCGVSVAALNKNIADLTQQLSVQRNFSMMKPD